MNQDRDVLAVGKSPAKVRVVKRKALHRIGYTVELCILETVWDKKVGPVYAVAFRNGGRMGYWTSRPGGSEEPIAAYPWNGMSMRQFLRWRSLKAAQVEFELRA